MLKKLSLIFSIIASSLIILMIIFFINFCFSFPNAMGETIKITNKARENAKIEIEEQAKEEDDACIMLKNVQTKARKLLDEYEDKLPFEKIMTLERMILEAEMKKARIDCY